MGPVHVVYMYKRKKRTSQGAHVATLLCFCKKFLLSFWCIDMSVHGFDLSNYTLHSKKYTVQITQYTVHITEYTAHSTGL